MGYGNKIWKKNNQYRLRHPELFDSFGDINSSSETRLRYKNCGDGDAEIGIALIGFNGEKN
ncbi:MAG: hypothetical protein HZB59_01055 [Ignavibacteriales bacterium]|nr:hypothetical protein [Ignavibacteriales bacterium]